MHEELNAFLQQQAQSAEEDFKQSLSNVLSEWKQESIEMLGFTNELFETTKSDFNKSIKRLQDTVENIRLSLDSLNNSEAIARSTQQLFKDYLNVQADFRSLVEKSLTGSYHLLGQQVIPDLQGLQQALFGIRSLLDQHNDQGRQQHTEVIARMTLSTDKLDQILKQYIEQFDLTKKIANRQDILTGQLERIADILKTNEQQGSAQMERLHVQSQMAREETKQGLELARSEGAKTKALVRRNFFFMFLMWAVFIYVVLKK